MSCELQDAKMRPMGKFEQIKSEVISVLFVGGPMHGKLKQEEIINAIPRITFPDTKGRWTDPLEYHVYTPMDIGDMKDLPFQIYEHSSLNSANKRLDEIEKKMASLEKERMDIMYKFGPHPPNHPM